MVDNRKLLVLRVANVNNPDFDRYDLALLIGLTSSLATNQLAVCVLNAQDPALALVFACVLIRR